MMWFHVSIALVILASIVSILITPNFQVHKTGIILISGASSGIGLHASRHLANLGYTVFAGVRKDSDFDLLKSIGNPLLKPILLDVTNHDSILSAVESIKAYAADIHLPFIAIVNNAGVSRRNVAEFHDLIDAKAVFETNFFGMLDLTQVVLPLLRESKGRIVMISSLSGVIGVPMSSIYSSSKFAMEGFADALRREVKEFGISVSLVEPGYVKSAIFDKSAARVKTVTHENPEMMKVYPEYYSAASFEKREKALLKASDPIVTSDAIAHAIMSEKPNTRYFVANYGGVPAVVFAYLARIVPDRMIDVLYKVF